MEYISEEEKTEKTDGFFGAIKEGFNIRWSISCSLVFSNLLLLRDLLSDIFINTFCSFIEFFTSFFIDYLGEIIEYIRLFIFI